MLMRPIWLCFTLFLSFRRGKKKKRSKTISITVGGVSCLLLGIPTSYCTVCSSIGSSFFFLSSFTIAIKMIVFEVRDFE